MIHDTLSTYFMGADICLLKWLVPCMNYSVTDATFYNWHTVHTNTSERTTHVYRLNVESINAIINCVCVDTDFHLTNIGRVRGASYGRHINMKIGCLWPISAYYSAYL